jgi:hypothetical protein
MIYPGFLVSLLKKRNGQQIPKKVVEKATGYTRTVSGAVTTFRQSVDRLKQGVGYFKLFAVTRRWLQTPPQTHASVHQEMLQI